MKHSLKNLFMAGAAALTLSTTTQAEILWSEIGISVLQGDGYLAPWSGEEDAGTVYSVHHAGAYNWGKSFGFMDLYKSSDDVLDNSTYMELGSDISLSWMTTADLSSKAAKDFYVVTQVEHAAQLNSFNYLAGVGARWKIPGFVFFDTNL